MIDCLPKTKKSYKHPGVSCVVGTLQSFGVLPTYGKMQMITDI